MRRSAADLLFRHRWTFGLFALFGVLLAVARVVRPDYGSAGAIALVSAALPYAFAVAAQTVVVISRGIDLSIASVMSLTSVTAARLMQDIGDDAALPIVVAVLGIGVLIGAINGTLIVLTRVPDIVATLAMLFVWQGAALLVLEAPGGTAAEWLKRLVVGSVEIPGVPDAFSSWVPRALILLVLSLCVVWLPLRRSRLGLSIYAIGSDGLAAFRSGVDVSRTKIAAYAIAGLFSAMGGVALTMSTGIGAPIPGPYLLASIAAVVLGGVSLAGGRGGLLGPIVAVFILRLVRSILTFLALDPNVTTIVEGAIMVLVVMLGAMLTMRSQSK